MAEHNLTETLPGASDFDRPLLLTPSEDLKGFVLNRAGAAVLFTVACTSVLAVLLIFVFVIREAVGFLSSHSVVDFVTGLTWRPEEANPHFGILTFIVGSFYVTITAMLIAVPIGLLAAVFLSDVTSYRIRGIAKPIIELLAAIPSVAYGFFAVLIFGPLLQKYFGFASGINALNASIILAIMALPTIISVAEDSLSAIGRDLREASYGLGATRMETMIKVVIPAAHSGIIAAVILGMMRAVGETMVVWMAAGNSRQIIHPWWDLSKSVGTMTATIAGEMGEAVKGSDHYQALFAMGFLLLLITFILNTVSEYFLAQAKKGRGGTK